MTHKKGRKEKIERTILCDFRRSLKRFENIQLVLFGELCSITMSSKDNQKRERKKKKEKGKEKNFSLLRR
jgi:hypothetical protein